MTVIPSPKRYPFHLTYLNAVSMQDTIDWANRCVQMRTAAQLVIATADLYVNLQRNAALRDAINACPMIHAGDQAIVIASRLFGIPVPARISQFDLVDKLLTLANQKRYRIFIAGGQSETLQQVEMYIRLFYPYLHLSGMLPSWGSSREEAKALRKIAASGADLLFVSLPSPDKELWVHHHLQELNVPLCIGADVAFTQFASSVKQTPSWIRGTVWERRLSRWQRGFQGVRSFSTYSVFAMSMARAWRHHKMNRATDESQK